VETLAGVQFLAASPVQSSIKIKFFIIFFIIGAFSLHAYSTDSASWTEGIMFYGLSSSELSDLKANENFYPSLDFN